MLSCLHTGVLAPEHSLDGDGPAGEEPAAARAYPTQSLGVSGGAPTALTGDTDMNGDMDYSSSSETGDREDEAAMSSGEDSDEESKPCLFPLAALCLHLSIGGPLCLPHAFSAHLTRGIPTIAQYGSELLHEGSDDRRRGLHGIRQAVYSILQALVRCHGDGSSGILARRLAPLQISRWMWQRRWDPRTSTSEQWPP